MFTSAQRAVSDWFPSRKMYVKPLLYDVPFREEGSVLSFTEVCSWVELLSSGRWLWITRLHFQPSTHACQFTFRCSNQEKFS